MDNLLTYIFGSVGNVDVNPESMFRLFFFLLLFEFFTQILGDLFRGVTR